MRIYSFLLFKEDNLYLKKSQVEFNTNNKILISLALLVTGFLGIYFLPFTQAHLNLASVVNFNAGNMLLGTISNIAMLGVMISGLVAGIGLAGLALEMISQRLISKDKFISLPASEQIQYVRERFGWYRGEPIIRIKWEDAKPASKYIEFYKQLYYVLSKKLKELGYENEKIYLGGHDVVQILLGLPRSIKNTEVNIYGPSDPAHLENNWFGIDLQVGVEAVNVEVNMESTISLYAMMEPARQKRDWQDALSCVQSNVLLKWNLVILTKEGIEVYPLDQKSNNDIETRTLRLDLGRGLLSLNALYYNLIVAYRALYEVDKPWHFDTDTKELISKSILKMKKGDLSEAIDLVAVNPSVNEGKGVEGGLFNLLEFVEEKISKEAAQRIAELKSIARESFEIRLLEKRGMHVLPSIKISQLLNQTLQDEPLLNGIIIGFVDNPDAKLLVKRERHLGENELVIMAGKNKDTSIPNSLMKITLFGKEHTLLLKIKEVIEKGFDYINGLQESKNNIEPKQLEKSAISLVVNTAEMKNKLGQLRELLPDDAPETIRQFGEFLKERLPENIDPDKFVIMVVTEMIDLERGIDADGNAMHSELAKEDGKIYDLIRDWLPAIVEKIAPENFSQEVKRAWMQIYKVGDTFASLPAADNAKSEKSFQISPLQESLDSLAKSRTQI